MTALATYRPKSVRVFDEMDRMIDSFFTGNSKTAGNARYPAVDVVEKAESYGLSVELPGYGKDDVEIKVDNNVLTISAVEEKTEEKKEDKNEEVSYVLRERSSRSFTRTFVLPKEADRDNIEASFEDGLLVLEIPKVPKAVPKKIDIKTK
jgi:HSP20 family protein